MTIQHSTPSVSAPLPTLKRTTPYGGRKRPYSPRGLRRLTCVHCGSPAVTQQWAICADGNVYRPFCTPCDVMLNAIVLEFMGLSAFARTAKLTLYASRMNCGLPDGADTVEAEVSVSCKNTSPGMLCSHAR